MTDLKMRLIQARNRFVYWLGRTLPKGWGIVHVYGGSAASITGLTPREVDALGLCFVPVDYVRDDEEIIQLKAKILEYEHAMEHVLDEANEYHTVCPGCQGVVKSAFDRLNKDDFIEMVREGDMDV